MPAARLATRAVLVSALTVTLVPVLGASPAFACKCVVSSDRQNYDRADVVFKAKLGKVTPRTREEDQVSGSSGSRVFEFVPGRADKGKVTTPQRVSTPLSSATCGVQLSGQGPFVVYAYKRSADDRQQDGRSAPKLAISSCRGTREIGPKEKLPFGPGRPVKATATDQAPSPASPVTTPPPAPVVLRSQAAMPTQIAIPMVGGILAAVVASAAWASRTRPVEPRR